MFRITLITAAACATLITTAAHADTKYVFRYRTAGILKTASVAPTEPEQPTEPGGWPRIEIDEGFLSHIDTNGNGRIDIGETVVATWTVRNNGTATADQMSAEDAIFFVRRQGESYGLGARASVICSSSTLAPGTSATCTSSLIVPDYFLEMGREGYFLDSSFNFGDPYYNWQESEKIPLA